MGCNTIFYSHWIQGTQSNLTCAFFLNLPWLYNLSSVTLKGTWTPCISGVVHFILRHCCKSGNLQRVRSKPYRHIWKLLPSQVSSAKGGHFPCEKPKCKMLPFLVWCFTWGPPPKFIYTKGFYHLVLTIRHKYLCSSEDGSAHSSIIHSWTGRTEFKSRCKLT